MTFIQAAQRERTQNGPPKHVHNDNDLSIPPQAVWALKAFQIYFLIFASVTPFAISHIQAGTLSVALSASHPSASFVIPPARLPRSSFCVERHRGRRVFLEIPAPPPGSDIYTPLQIPA